MQEVQSTDFAFYQPDPEHIAHNRSGLWIASAFELIALLLFVLILRLADPLAATLQGLPLIVLGLFMSILPAALWLGFFYRMDRLEPEPKEKLIAVFIVGALATGAIVIPLLEGFFQIDSWLDINLATQLFGGILLVGFLQEGIVYLTVRYAIYSDPEFDERVDGVLYAIAAGLGLATVVNFLYVIENGGVDLAIGSIRIVVTSLAHASFAGLLGYFLGQARFERTPPYYLPAGLALAALLNGVFFLVEDRISDAGLDVNPWNGLVLAAVFAVIVLGVVYYLIERANEETIRVSQRERGYLLSKAGAALLAQEEPPPSDEPTTPAAVAAGEGNDEGKIEESEGAEGEGAEGKDLP